MIIPICSNNHWFCIIVYIKANTTEYRFFDSLKIKENEELALDCAVKVTNEIMQVNKQKIDKPIV